MGQKEIEQNEIDLTKFDNEIAECTIGIMTCIEKLESVDDKMPLSESFAKRALLKCLNANKADLPSAIADGNIAIKLAEGKASTEKDCSENSTKVILAYAYYLNGNIAKADCICKSIKPSNKKQEKIINELKAAICKKQSKLKEAAKCLQDAIGELDISNLPGFSLCENYRETMSVLNNGW
jgi:hypothetical protein